MRLPLKMWLYCRAGRWLPFLRIRPPEIDRSAVFVLRPGRNSLLKWEKRPSGDVLLTVPQNERAGFVTRTLARWMNVPPERYVELDEVGGFVWELCDGNHTIDAIVQKTSRQFKMNRREAEVSVTMFLQMLHERNFIGFYRKVKKA
ncbi:MAG: PqqD family protein [Chloroherpetonaceae bacterium]|nr:PqqD family protein [Chthonomonadaceae bacterium]MDW8207499.1 PqqD family protein [Chloroherpetonaceae bacterium]